jgi:hypothetical protein
VRRGNFVYSEYERYLLNIRNSLIQNGIEFPEITKGSMSYYELFKLGIKLSDILLYYKVLAVSGSGDGLENFFLPINTSYVDKIRGICYSEFVSDVLPTYKKLSLGIEPEEETDDVALEEDDDTEEAPSDFSEDLFNSMFEEDSIEEDESDDTDDSIENDFDATIKQRLKENIEYVPNGVYLEESEGEKPFKRYSDDIVYTERGAFLDDEPAVEESDYSEEGYSESSYDEDEEDSYSEESDYSDEEDDYEESDYSEEEDDYEESDYSEEEADYEESDYSDDDLEESDYSNEEDDYEESDYSEDEEGDYSEDEYQESDYSEDEEDGYEESDYSEDEYEESDYSNEEDDYEESAYSEEDYSGGNYSEDEDSVYSRDSIGSVKPKKTKDLGDELQDITNTVLTNLKQKAVNFLKKKE